MRTLTRVSRLGILPALLWTVSCMNDSGGDKPPVAGESKTSGYFRVVLTEKTAISQGLPTVQGKVYAGAVPSAIVWREAAKSGACTLYTPKAPFCEKGCGSGGTCVADGVCEAFPKAIGVGTVTLTGLKTKAGAVSFDMTPILNGYQPPAGVTLEYNPFAEGDAVTASASGDTALAAFKVTGKAIARLAVLNDSIVLEDGKPILLRWTPPAKDVGSRISVSIDISHHGGSKGKIECETADNGSLDIAASLVDALKALGMSGWPAIEVTRKTVSTNDNVHVHLDIESPITKSLVIPGLISCTGPEDCPNGTTCQQDMQCK